VVIRLRKVKSGRGAREAVEVAAYGKCSLLGDLQRLKYAGTHD
jgi:hypothetical protein